MNGTTAAFTAAFTAKIKLIRLDLARQCIYSFVDLVAR
jgi:hypothetical protein